MFNDDSYFRNCENYFKNLYVKGLINSFIDFLNFLLCPIYKSDQLLEEFLENFVRIFIVINSCALEGESTRGEYDVSLNSLDATYLWKSSESFTQRNNLKEGFNLESTPELWTTVKSFVENHSWISNNTLIAKTATYYIQELNEAETARGEYFSDEELFTFNSLFDNKLSDRKNIITVMNIAIDEGVLEYMNSTGDNSGNTIDLNSRAGTGYDEIYGEYIGDDTYIGDELGVEEEKEEIPKTPCEKKQDAAIKALKKTVSKIKDQIYNIVMVPVLIFVTYNMYYLFFFMEPTTDKVIVPKAKKTSISGMFKNLVGKAKDFGAKLQGVKPETGEPTPPNQAPGPGPGPGPGPPGPKQTGGAKSCKYIKFYNVDEIFDNDSEEYTTPGIIKFFSDCVFKPITLTITALEFIKGNKIKRPNMNIGGTEAAPPVEPLEGPGFLRNLNNTAPWLMFFFLFVIIYVSWNYSKNFMGDLVRKLVTGKKLMPDWLAYAFFYPIVYFFALVSLYKSKSEMLSDTVPGMPGKGTAINYLFFIVFVIFKVIITIFIAAISPSLFVIYFVIYSFFGIFMNNNEPFKEIDLMSKFIYAKLYDELPNTNAANVTFNLFLTIIRSCYSYMFEIVTIIVLALGLTTYVKTISNPDLNLFLWIMHVFCIGLIIFYAGIKGAKLDFNNIVDLFYLTKYTYDPNDEEKIDTQEPFIEIDGEKIKMADFIKDKLRNILPNITSVRRYCGLVNKETDALDIDDDMPQKK